jgi:predicted MFS family arabinose efflux permease
VVRASPSRDPSTRSERALIFLIGAVQFINILDFMMVMPLGPDFARALGIPASRLGYIGGSYTAAASVSGLLCSLFLDRFGRRSALVVSLIGLSLGTALGGVARSFEGLLFARCVAGAFGGPATSLSFSIIADVIPPERRGRATGAVMGAFSIASIAGVPIGLELARQGTWNTPFFVVAAVAIVITIAAALSLPPLRGHIDAAKGRARVAVVTLLRPEILASYAMTALVMCGGFILVPNISAYLQGNLGYPRAELGWLYFGGGAVSFFSTRFAGGMVDRFGSLRTVVLGVALLAVSIFVGFILTPPPIPIISVFMLFMLAMGFRNVAYNTLTSKVPRPEERAQFMSLQSAVQHMASALGAFWSSKLLSEGPNQSLVGMLHVASIAIAMALVLPFFVWRVERNIREMAQT